MNNIVKVEIHKCKKIINNLNSLEGMLNILTIYQPTKEQMLNYIIEIKDILKEAKLDERVNP